MKCQKLNFYHKLTPVIIQHNPVTQYNFLTTAWDIHDKNIDMYNIKFLPQLTAHFIQQKNGHFSKRSMAWNSDISYT